MSSPQNKKSKGTNILLSAARASNFSSSMSDHHNFTHKELLDNITKHEKVLELMLDSSMALSFSEEEKQKLLRGLDNTSERLEKLRSLLSMKLSKNSNYSRQRVSKGTLKRK